MICSLLLYQIHVVLTGGACSTLDTVQMLIRMEALDDEMIKRLLGDACKQITGVSDF